MFLKTPQKVKLLILKKILCSPVSVPQMTGTLELGLTVKVSVWHCEASEAGTPPALASPDKILATLTVLVFGPVMTKVTKSSRS
jgi:hypothetical protein